MRVIDVRSVCRVLRRPDSKRLDASLLPINSREVLGESRRFGGRMGIKPLSTRVGSEVKVEASILLIEHEYVLDPLPHQPPFAARGNRRADFRVVMELDLAWYG